MKTYNDCYLYNKYPAYNTILFKAIMTNNIIDKSTEMFKDIIYEVKRTRVSQGLLTVLTSPKTVLFFPEKVLPKPFVTFVAKNPRDGKNLNLFIDCTNAIQVQENGYKINDIRLVSHLISGYFNMRYNRDEANMFNASIKKTSATCFALLFAHIIDYLGKISIIEGAKDKCIYFAARYYLENICELEVDTARNIAKSITGFSEIKENTLDFSIEDKKPFETLKSFVEFIKKEFKMERLTTDIIVEKWMYLYGSGSVFALEFLPAFITMITDAYCGAFINNQKTIEKICGRNMVMLAKDMIELIG